jgi:hypothetical protein
MGIIYRTTSTPNVAATQIKGGALTHAQLDGNLAFISASYVASDVTSSMSVASAASSTTVIGSIYPNGLGPNPLTFKFIAGSGATVGGTPSTISIPIPELVTNTLGVDCFVTATATGSVPLAGAQAIHVNNLSAGVLTFGSNPGVAVGFNFHILYR